ncbi:hypothetical protein [Povalibacter sp.]
MIIVGKGAATTAFACVRRCGYLLELLLRYIWIGAGTHGDFA